MTKILVTGSDGYIGAVLTQDLQQCGYEVTGLDTQYFNQAILGKYNSRYRLFKKDIRSILDLDLSQFTAIIHLAALSNDPLGEISPKVTEEINFQATVKLAQLAKIAGVKRFLFSSSCSIYGIAQNGIVNETSEVNPLTAYAKSKILAEKELRKLADENFYIGILRNSTVYGYSPKFRSDLVVNELVSSAIASGQIMVKSDGTPWRPLIDVRDLSEIFIRFLAVKPQLINGKIFNIGFNENNLQVKDIISKIKKELPDCEVIYIGEHGADTRSYRVNFSKLHRIFPDLKQKWPLSDSIPDLISHLRKQKNYQKDFLGGKFTRLKVLKELIYEHQLDENLYWVKS